MPVCAVLATRAPVAAMKTQLDPAERGSATAWGKAPGSRWPEEAGERVASASWCVAVAIKECFDKLNGRVNAQLHAGK